ncbi:hypothetical protein D5281_12660 [bacterium 1xD42-62]|uniref:Uncharacterized protein n=2 Tax=Parablautia muri TaxID=2320879 RepID=A0A9X5BGR3_9FIRM|nr:hypothetical protein [Parablautia muri]
MDEVVRMLDALTANEVSRIKVEASEQMEEGQAKKTYHHGRCDVGSPYATGKLYDLEEPMC